MTASRFPSPPTAAKSVAGYVRTFGDPAHPLTVLIECDTGGGRCGVQSPGEALALAKLIVGAPGLRFGGLMTYPARRKTAEVEEWFQKALAVFKRAGIHVERVSTGGSPDFYDGGMIASATEHRPGTYIYSDRMQVAFGHGRLEDCALTVLATVVSSPTRRPRDP